MVRVISLETALAQGETPASITALILWHQTTIASIERAKGKLSRQLAGSVPRHRETIAELKELLRQLKTARAAAVAADAA